MIPPARCPKSVGGGCLRGVRGKKWKIQDFAAIHIPIGSLTLVESRIIARDAANKILRRLKTFELSGSAGCVSSTPNRVSGTGCEDRTSVLRSPHPAPREVLGRTGRKPWAPAPGRRRRGATSRDRPPYGSPGSQRFQWTPASDTVGDEPWACAISRQMTRLRSPTANVAIVAGDPKAVQTQQDKTSDARRAMGDANLQS